MINCANNFTGFDNNPALKMTAHATEILTETACNSASVLADKMLKFSQALSKCKSPQDALSVMSNLAQENAATAMSATQKACSALLESFSAMGNPCAETLNAASPIMATEAPARSRRPARD